MSTKRNSTASLQPFVLKNEVFYSIDVAARLAGMPRHRILVCCKRGIITPRIDPDDGRYSFDAGTIWLLQRIEYLNTECGVNLTGIQIILSLVDEVERFRQLEDERLHQRGAPPF